MLEMKDTILLSVAAEKTGRSIEDLLMEYDLPVYYWLPATYVARTPQELVESLPDRVAQSLQEKQRVAIAEGRSVIVDPVGLLATRMPPMEIKRKSLYLRRKDVAKLEAKTAEQKSPNRGGRPPEEKNQQAEKRGWELLADNKKMTKDGAADIAARECNANFDTVRKRLQKRKPQAE